MGAFARFFSDDAGDEDAPIVPDENSTEESRVVPFDYLLAMMETGKI